MAKNVVIMKKNWLFSLWARGKQTFDTWAAARQGRGGGELRDLEGKLKRRKGGASTGTVEAITNI
jgi:hypothetical protein